MKMRLGTIAVVGAVLANLVGVGLVLAALLEHDRRAEVIIGWITGALLPSVGFLLWFLKSRNLTVYILTARFRSLFTDRTPTWVLSASWRSDRITRDLLNEIQTRLTEALSANQKVEVKRLTPWSLVLNVVPGPTLEFQCTEPSEEVGDIGNSLYVRVRNYRVDYRRTARVFKHEITPILNLINGIVGSAETRFTLNVVFDKAQNPFIGLFIENLPENAIKQFEIHLDLSTLDSLNKVTISQESISINTRTNTALQNLALEFLGLDFTVAKRLRDAN